MEHVLKIAALSLAVMAASVNSYANYDDYISANGIKVELGQSKRYLESKFGIPEREDHESQGWGLANGNHLYVKYDEYGASSISISGGSPDYLIGLGKRITLNRDTLQQIERNQPYGCYHQGWGEGWVGEYVIRSGPEGSWNLIATHWSDDDEKNIKNKKITSLQLTYDEPFGDEQYCKY